MRSELNNIRVSGKLGAPAYSHKSKGTDYYKAVLTVRKTEGGTSGLTLVGTADLFRGLEGKFVMADGRIRTFSPEVDGRTRLFVEVWPDTVTETGDFGEDVNLARIRGMVLKSPWHMDFGSRSLSTFLLINREGHSTWCVPCSAWNRNARYSMRFREGDLVEASGPLNSRDYDAGGEKRRTHEIEAAELKAVRLAKDGKGREETPYA